MTAFKVVGTLRVGRSLRDRQRVSERLAYEHLFTASPCAVIDKADGTQSVHPVLPLAKGELEGVEEPPPTPPWQGGELLSRRERQH